MSDIAPLPALVDTDAYSLHERSATAHRDLVERCRSDLDSEGLFDLPGFLRPDVLPDVIASLRPLVDHASFVHRRVHNIYFSPTVPGLAPDHPALRPMETSNRTVCGDQLAATGLVELYEWSPLRRFLAEVLSLPTLHLMDDPLARINVMSYRQGEALNWHFDRSLFTTTLVLQAARHGGDFEYRAGLRDHDDPNYDGVGRLVAGLDREVRQRAIEPGTLSVFTGHNTAHRVTQVEGDRDRIVAVFSYFPEPGVSFSPAERIGFYGRA